MKILRMILFTGLCSLQFLSSCKKDDFLDRKPESDLTEDNFFNNGKDLETYCNGLYSFLPSAYIALQDDQSDNFVGSPFNHVVAGKIVKPTDADEADWEVDAGNPGWNWSFLRKVNYFLQQYHKADAPEPLKDHYAGIARFFRAWFYYEKVIQYGDVPWYGTTILPNDSTNLFKGRDDRSLVMDSVMADLDFAVNHIKPTGPSGTVTKWAAYALMARVALFEGTFREYHGLDGWKPFLKTADTAALAVMNSGEYSLYTTGNPTEDYRKLFLTFTPSDPQNKEIILARFYSDELHTTYPLDGYIATWGFGLTKDLVNSYLMKNGQPFTAQNGYKKETITQEFKNRDPRLKQTILSPEDSLGELIGAKRLGPAPTGYQQIKYYDPETPTWNKNTNAALIFRYGEILLIYAEAGAELANAGTGSFTQTDLDQSINLLRDRAGMPHLSMNVPVDPVLAAKYPQVNGPMKNVLLEIRRERRVELAAEGHRYWDLMRWKAGKLLERPFLGEYFSHLGAYDFNGDGKIDLELVNSSPTKPYQKQVGVDVHLSGGNSGNIVPYPDLNKSFDENKNYYFPLPETELLLNSHLKQNPGWE